jgi:protein-S-isoprenylcysteine O-methyltransferase Ste14
LTRLEPARTMPVSNVIDRPLLIITLCIWTYWLVGIALVLRNRFIAGSPAGVIPRERIERYMWLLWVPLIVLWNLLPALAMRKDDPPWALPAFAAASTWITALRWLAACLGVAALLMTISCWFTMGRSWRVAIVPGEKTMLVTSGLFRFVRHPIYALSCLLIACSAIVLPTWPMIAVAITHIALMNIKARREEEFLRGVHGEAYENYVRRTGRFLPRM